MELETIEEICCCNLVENFVFCALNIARAARSEPDLFTPRDEEADKYDTLLSCERNSPLSAAVRRSGRTS